MRKEKAKKLEGVHQMDLAKKIYDKMVSIVGGNYVTDDFFERINNIVDAFPYNLDLNQEKMPYVVVRPENEGEISEIIKFTNEENIPVYPRVSGTTFTGAARPSESGIVLNLNRLKSMHIDTIYGYFECGSGATVDYVNSELEKEGFFLPVYPGSRLVASMGGVISNNTSGHIIDACIGKPADYLLGLRVVLPTGEILDTGTKGLRRPAGTDLTKFFVGGDGLLGVITSIRMMLVPSKKKAFGMACFKNAESIARAVVRMYRENAPPPLFMEFMDKKSAVVGFEDAGLKAPPGPVIFFASLGSTEEEVAYNINKLIDVMKEENPISAERIKELDVWLKIWTAREVIISSLMRKHDGQFTGGEIVTALPNLLDCIKECEKFPSKDPIFEGVPFYLFGHTGALTFHPTFILPKSWDDDRKRRFVDIEFEKECEMNLKYGTCGGEWGQFKKRNSFFKRRYGDKAYQLIKETKKVFDPNNILNRGVLE
jgi:glycolate oxidase